MTQRTAIVWGLGRFGGGIAAAAHLHDRGYEVRIIDRAPRAALASSLDRLAALGVPRDIHVLPEEAASLDDATVLVVSPAVPPRHALLAAATRRGLRRTQELDLFLEAYPGSVVAVTGTNGKSTTAAMLAAALSARDPSDADAVLLGGNIGHSLLLDRERWRTCQIAVVEVSSFQAERLELEPPRLAHLVYTPITRDHVAWHGSVGAYRAAKLRLRAAVEPGGIILSAGDALPQLDAPMPWPGKFNAQNAALALGLAIRLGVGAQTAQRGILAFEGLPHRLHAVGRRNGVLFVDNGASTIAETSRAALLSFDRATLHWVAGGRPKEDELDQFAGNLAPHAASIHCFGEIAAALAARLAHAGHAVTAHDALHAALDAAWAEARPGDVILFSPGCTSHDRYPNFAARAADALAWWQHRVGAGETLESGQT